MNLGRMAAVGWLGGAPDQRPVVTTDGTLYRITLDANLDLRWKKSTDRGFTWTWPALILAGQLGHFGIWYDRWSSGSGTLIHIVVMDSTVDGVYYFNLDTATDTVSTVVAISNPASVLNSTNAACTITRARGGNLVVAYDSDGGTETGCYKSTDGGANWSSIDNSINEAASTDWYFLMPDYQTDPQDVIAFFWDRSANQLTIKRYDDSGNTWAETEVAASMVDGHMCFDATPDLANSRNLFVAWSAFDTANADLRFWSVSASTITESATNVILNSVDDQGLCAIGLETDTIRVYIVYYGKSDGTDTFQTSGNIYFKTSDDLGSTWSAEQQVTQNRMQDQTARISVPLNFISGQFRVFWSQIDAGGGTSGEMDYMNTEIESGVVFGGMVSVASGTDKTTGTTFSTPPTTTQTILAGQLIVVGLVTDNDASADGVTTLHSAVTVGGLGLTKAYEYTNAQGGSGNGATLSVWYGVAVSDIIAGATVASTLSTGKDAKALVTQVFNWDSDFFTATVDGTQFAADDAADPSSITATGTLTSRHLWLRFIGVETDQATAGTLTPTSGWRSIGAGTGTTGGAAASNVSIRCEYKIADGTGSGASDPTLVAADSVSIIVGLAATATGGASSDSTAPFTINGWRRR